VYWTNNSGGTVMKCAVGGCGGAPTLLANNQLQPYAIATDGINVYWTTGVGNIMRCPVGGCGNAPVIIAHAQGNIGGVAVDATSVYWTNAGPPGSVMKLTPK
jgi:hypothetical protein